MADEPTKESGAKRARVDETSQSSLRMASTEVAPIGRGTSDRGSDRGSDLMDTSSSIEESVTGSNREGAVFLLSSFRDADKDYHNYSSTARWRKRCSKWDQWARDNVFIDSFDLRSLRLLTGEELFLKIDDSSLTGKKLVIFAADIQVLKDSVRSLDGEIETLNAELKTLNEEISSLPSPTSQPTVVAKLIEKLIKEKQERIKEKQERIKEKQERIKEKQECIRDKTDNVGTFLKDIYSAHRQMRNKFSYVKSKGNEDVLSITSKMQSLDIRIDLEKISSPSEFDDFLPKPNYDFTNGLIQQFCEDEKATLCAFRRFVVELFNVATKTDRSGLVKNTTDAIRDWKPEATVDKNTQYARPPTDSNKEETVDHPILRAVICRIIGILVQKGQKEVLYPHEFGVTTEQRVAGSMLHNMRERKIDVTIHQSKEYLQVVLATMVQKAIEIKTGPDSKKKLLKALEKGRSQVVGHLGKWLLYAFDFGGAGQDDHVVGLSLTPLSIEVIQMSLYNVGTKDVALEVIGTGCVPLLGKEHLTTEQKDAFVSESLEIDGFVLLAGALKHGILQEFSHPGGTSVKQVRPYKEDLKIINYLGSGAFANVVRLNQGEFMKMPKSAPLANSLIQEANILRKIQSGEGSSNIPKLVVDKDEGVSVIQTVIRGEISYMQSLRLTGVVGLPLSNVPHQLWEKHANVIITTVYKTLEYAHRKSIYHLDVRPGNIIVKPEQDRCCVMLSDWGCSVDATNPNTTTLKSFRGCTPYAHDRLLGKKFQGKLDCELDFASLAYTVYHVYKGRLLWIFEFDHPTNVKSSDLEFRRKFVKEWLEKDGTGILSQEVSDVMMAACCPRRSERTEAPVKLPDDEPPLVAESSFSSTPS